MSLRVLHIIHNLEIGGAQSHLANLAAEPHVAIDRQAVISWKRGGPLAAVLQDRGVPLTQPPKAGLLAAWSHIREVAQALRPSLVHAHMPDSAFWAARLSHRYGMPFVTTFSNGTQLVPDMPAWKRRIRATVLRHDAKRAAMNIAVSEPLEALMRRSLGVRANRIVHIPNCIRLPDAGALDEADRTGLPVRHQPNGLHQTAGKLVADIVQESFEVRVTPAEAHHCHIALCGF